MTPLCACSKRHSPRVMVTDTHHICPRSWSGPDVAANRVELCPTTHRQVHRLIDAYVSAGAEPAKSVVALYNALTRDLAAQAWARRPANPTRTSLSRPEVVDDSH